MKHELEKLIQKCIAQAYDFELDVVKLDLPPKKELGDFAFGAFQLSRNLKKNPALIAQDFSKVLVQEESIESAIAAGPYINIKVNKQNTGKYFADFYDSFLSDALFEKKSEKIVVDYIGPNVGKPLHIGHMCTPNIGQTIINLHKVMKYDIVGDTHIGDWGIIFGKLIYAFKRWGSDDLLTSDPINHLLDLYVKVSAEEGIEDEYRAEFKKLSQGNTESIKYWKEFTLHSIQAMNKSLEVLNVFPDYNIGESFYEGLPLGKLEDIPDLKDSMSDIVEELIDKGIAIVNEDNSVGVEFGEDVKIPSVMLRKRDGTHGYLASDLACIKYRIKKFHAKKIYYFVDIRQKLHFEQCFEIARMAGWLEGGIELEHAPNGFVSLKNGAMSTRTGNIIRLELLLDEAQKRAKDIIVEKQTSIVGGELDELAKTIGIGAIKYAYLKKSRENDVVFDWDEFMSFEGNNAPYIQYSYVRATRILEKYKQDNLERYNSVILEGYTGDIFKENDEIFLIQLLLEYKERLTEVASRKMPHILCKYVYELTKAFSSFYTNVHILNEQDTQLQDSRVRLVYLYTMIMKQLFYVLAIDLPKKM